MGPRHPVRAVDSPAPGLQSALLKLGHIPEYHQRDVFSVSLLREGEEPMTLAWLRETQLAVDMQRFLPETGHPMILPGLKKSWFFHRTPRLCYGTTRVEATSLRRIEGARDFTFQDHAFSIQVGLGNWYG